MNYLSLFAAVFLILSNLIGLAMPATSPSKVIHTMSPNPEPYQVVYDDGTKSPLLQLRVEGDVSSSAPLIYEETLDGFTVKLNKRTRKYTYLNVDLATGDMIETDFVAGEDDPYLYKVAKNAVRQGQQIKDALPKVLKSNSDEGHNRRKLERQNERRTRVTSGVLKNIVIPFKFADHSSRNVPSKSDLHTLMNNVGSHPLCPTGSVRDHYLQTSFNNLDLQSTVAEWVTIDYTEAFCANGVSGLTSTIQICIKNALDKAVEAGVNFGNFDMDDDGFVDGITFFHSGYAAEFGGVASGTPYSDRIWSHKWSLHAQPFTNNGVTVYEYHINPAMWGISGSNIGRIGVVTHELGHFLGLPDLYDYGDAVYGNGEGIGSYGLMANSWGFDYTQQYPPLMSAWSKYKLGWVTPTEVSNSGSYSLGQSCDNDEIVIIKEGYPSGEYLLIENRQSCGFDAAMPSRYGGLAIFHIEENGNNILGHPDQTGWPSNGNHYKVALLQADGNYGLEKSWNRGDSGDLFQGGFVDSIGPQGISTGASYPNTKSYQNGNVKNTEVSISNISPANAKMTFDVTIGSPPSSSSCIDSPYKLKINLGNGKWATQACSWVAVSPSSRCALAGVSKACPSTCGSCDTCANAPMKFRMPVWINGQKKMRFKHCNWIRKQRNKRCKMAGVKATCRQACGTC